jgi:hypothetical protein
VAVLPLEDREIMVRFLAEARISSLFHSVQTCRGSPKPNYPVGTGFYFPEDKAMGLNYGKPSAQIKYGKPSAQIKSECSHTATSFYAFVVCKETD